MSNFFRVMFSFIENAEFIALMRSRRALLGFFSLLRLKFKMESNYFLPKILYVV